MPDFSFALAALVVAGAILATAGVAQTEPPVVPAPRSIRWRAGEVWIPVAPEPVIAAGAETAAGAAAFAETWERLTGHRARIADEASTPDASWTLALDRSLAHEAYRLEIDRRTTLTGGSVAGIAHGLATLVQLARPGDGAFELPSVVVEDAPAAPFRAVMVDVARQPHRIDQLRAVVDLLHLYKIRYLHLHLTDNQAFTFPYPPVTDQLANNRTIALDDWRQLVADADARGVTIIPELDLPGHSAQLKASGYLEDPTPDDPLTDADVAHEANHARIFAIVDAMLEVFGSSPYFHIGGDESGAGPALVPFLAAANRHLRDAVKPPRRLLVWEGFQGSPDGLPARGDDRVCVVAWESHYNPPWHLLDAGYEIVNASWKPLYVVGGGAPRYPHIGGRRWPARDIHAWSKDQFWHWQAGTPVFEDRGPNDPHPDDGVWHAPATQRAQILGGQLCFWEQRAHTVLPDAWERVPALADRLWCGDRAEGLGYVSFQRRLDAVQRRVQRLVRPVRMLLAGGEVDLSHPTTADGVWFDRAVRVLIDAPTRLGVATRVTRDGTEPDASSPRYEAPLTITEPTTLIANAFLGDQPLGASTRATFDPRPAKVRVAWFDLPRRALDHVPDFRDRSQWTPQRVDLLPELRGPYRTTEPVGQALEGTFMVGDADSGPHGFRLKTRDGRAELFVDGVRILGPSARDETPLIADVALAPGRHAVRVHHASGPISPTLLVAIRPPGDDQFVGIEQVLEPIPRGTEPDTVAAPAATLDLLDGLAHWRWVCRDSDSTLGDIAQLDANGVLRLAGQPHGYLETRRWYRDYTLSLEWRWPEESGGNSGVLVHATAPLLFYGWPRSLEVQLAAGRAGEFWTIGAGVSLTVEDDTRRRRVRAPRDLHRHRRIARRVDDVEYPPGAWNQMEIRCRGDTVVVTVNGRETNRAIDVTVREGAIGLQSEGAPIEFRNVRLAPILSVVR